MNKPSFGGEQCAGCGQFASQHPVAAIMAAEDATGTEIGSSEDKKFVVVAVCRACHVDPAYRQVPLKAHFFESRGEALSSVGFAGERDAAGNPKRSGKKGK